MKNQNKIIIVLVAIILILAITLSFVLVKNNRNKSKDDNKKVESTQSDLSEGIEDLPDNPKDFESLQQKTPDICGWITIPGIEQIDYPIMQSALEKDDNFYLNHNSEGEPARDGSIYIQKLNSKAFDDPNTVIYGHNMSNNSMFGKLYDGSGKQFCNKEFFDAHRTIFVYIPGHILEYEIISAFVYDDRHIINSFNFDIEEERMDFYADCLNPPSITKQVLEGTTLESEDKIITLSTCTGNPSERYLVIGKLINDTKTK